MTFCRAQTTRLPRSMCRRSPRRSGTVLAIVVVALFVVTLLGAAICQSFLVQQRTNRQRSTRLQALWILESAAQRGLQRLAAEDDYRGETWDIPAETLSAQHAGRATIRVEDVTEPQTGQRLFIDVQFPVDDLHRTVFQRELFRVSPASGGSS